MATKKVKTMLERIEQHKADAKHWLARGEYFTRKGTEAQAKADDLSQQAQAAAGKVSE